MSKMSAALREKRKASGLSVSEVLAKLKEVDINISDKTLYNWETGTRSPNADEFFQLCVIYGVKNFSEFREEKEAPASEEAEARERAIDSIEVELSGLLASLGVDPDTLTADQADFLIHTVALIKAYFKK